MQHVTMTQSSSLGVLYSYCLWTLTNATDAEPSSIVLVPHMARQLAWRCPVSEALVSWSIKGVQHSMAKGIEPWVSFGGDYVALLRSIVPDSAESATRSATTANTVDKDYGEAMDVD